MKRSKSTPRENVLLVLMLSGTLLFLALFFLPASSAAASTTTNKNQSGKEGLQGGSSSQQPPPSGPPITALETSNRNCIKNSFAPEPAQSYTIGINDYKSLECAGLKRQCGSKYTSASKGCSGAVNNLNKAYGKGVIDATTCTNGSIRPVDSSGASSCPSYDDAAKYAKNSTGSQIWTQKLVGPAKST